MDARANDNETDRANTGCRCKRSLRFSDRSVASDAQIVMGAVAAATNTIKLGTTCLIAPYRHPLSDARQLATIDVLSEGRVMVGVAAGWMAEEYAAPSCNNY